MDTSEHEIVRIERFISGVKIGDGGTQHWEVLLDDGSVLKMGRDGGLKSKTNGLLFVGDTHPDLGKVRFLEKGSHEENEVITAISDYLDRTCGGSWREWLSDSKRLAEFEGDTSIGMALDVLWKFFFAIK